MKRLLLTFGLLVLSAPGFAATCKISEYSQMVSDEQGRTVPVALEDGSTTTQNVTYTTDTDSSAFASSTRFIRIVCDAKAHFVFGTGTITATANSPYLSADTPEYFAVLPGASLKVSFYDGTS